MNNKPVAYVNSMCNDYIDWKVEPMSIDGQSLYTHPVKYCPSENNEAYEKGFIDGMAKMTESAVHRAVEGMAVKELTDDEIMALWVAKNKLDGAQGIVDFARAILRKASEK
jgi:hypothetical protein